MQNGHQRVGEMVEVVLVDDGEELLQEGLDKPLGATDPVKIWSKRLVLGCVNLPTCYDIARMMDHAT